MIILESVESLTDGSDRDAEHLMDVSEFGRVSQCTMGVSIGPKLESGPLPYRYF